MKNQDNDTFSLAHTTWRCQYHIVFTPKYHRKVIYGALRAEIGKIMRELCRRKSVEIIEAHAMPDHINMLVSIPPNERVSTYRTKRKRTCFQPKSEWWSIMTRSKNGWNHGVRERRNKGDDRLLVCGRRVLMMVLELRAGIMPFRVN